jgi:hypothetical protein
MRSLRNAAVIKQLSMSIFTLSINVVGVPEILGEKCGDFDFFLKKKEKKRKER